MMSKTLKSSIDTDGHSPFAASCDEWRNLIASSEVVRTELQPTAAQIKWLHAIASAQVIRHSNAWTSPRVRRSTQGIRKSSYPRKIFFTSAGQFIIGKSEAPFPKGSLS